MVSNLGGFPAWRDFHKTQGQPQEAEGPRGLRLSPPLRS